MSLLSAVWILMGVVFIAFTGVILIGAPFLPTLHKQVPRALDLIDLKPGQLLLELGSGDGRVLIEAAKREIKSIGYEINPLLFAYSWVITRKYRAYITVVLGNYWSKKLPPADGIFVFLLKPYMLKLDKKITQEIPQYVKLISFAFEIPNKKPIKEDNGLFLYEYPNNR